MERVDLDWKNLGFGILPTDYNILYRWRDGGWSAPEVRTSGDITLVWCPGSFEIPSLTFQLVRSNRFDAVITLGCVIRGGTDHYHHIANEAAKGVAQIALESPIPVIFGVLTTDSIERAVERAGTKMGNKGADAAMSAIEMVNLRAALNERLSQTE